MSAPTVAHSQELWQQRAVPGRDVLMREVEDEAVLLDLNSGRYFGLDPVGTRMWALLTTAGSVGAACDQLLTEYEISADTLRRDVAELIEKLVTRGLLVVVDA